MKRENLVTRERFLKADLAVSRDAAGYINRACVDDRSILAYLFANHHLDWKHIDSAGTYSMWQYAFNKPFYAEPRKLYLIEIVGGSSSGNDCEAAYRKLLRKLDQYHQQAIEHAITKDVGEWNREGVYAARGKYLSAFNMLCRFIEEIVGEINPPINTACAKAQAGLN